MLTIGELAKRAGTNAVTIRYYEERQLISTSERSEGGHRLYPENFIQRLRFIQNAKSVGFSLEEIQTLLKLQENKKGSSQPIKKMALVKIQLIDEKIAALQDIKLQLTGLSRQCDGTMPIQHCPILSALQSDSDENNRKITKSKSSKKIKHK